MNLSLNKSDIAGIKSELKTLLPDVRPSDRVEAMALR